MTEHTAFNINRTIADLADLGVAYDDSALRSRISELNALAAAEPPPSPDSVLANKLLYAWSEIYGDKNTWPRELVESYKTVTAGIGFSSFEPGLISALQNIRTEREAALALQVALEVIWQDDKYAHVAAEMKAAIGSGLIPESAAMAGLDFVENPVNLILPIYGGALAGRLGGAIVARFGTTLGLTAEALAGIGTVSSTVAEGAGFVTSSRVIASVAKQSSTFVNGIASVALLPRNDIFTEIASASLFFGALRIFGRGGELAASLMPATETGVAIAKVIGHSTAVSGLAATEELQEMAGIGQPACSGKACFAESSRASSATTFYERMWRSLFLYTTLSATRGVIGEATGQPNAAHQISAEALELVGSMRIALREPALLNPSPLVGEGMGEGDHPPLAPLPSREGKSIIAMRSTGSVGSAKAVAAPPSPPPPVNKQWGIYVVQVPGHGLAPDYFRQNNQLAVKGTTPEAHIVLRGVGKDGRLIDQMAQTVDLENNGLFDEYASGPGSSRHLEKHILNSDAMASFFTESADHFPADRVCVSFEGHSGELRQFIPEIHAGLKALTEKLGRKIDIILFDSCFMAQIEIATQFSDVARFLVASQEGVVKFRPLPLISRWISKEGDTTPRELAEKIALNNREFTFSAIDLEKVATLNQAIKGLGEAILTINDHAAFKAIRKAVRDATGYYTEGLFSHNHFSNTVDLKGYIKGIEKNPYLRKNFRGVTEAAARVLEVFGKKGEGIIIEERHAKKTDQYYLDYTDVRGSNGLSIHQRITPKWLWNAYTHLKDSAFNIATGWDKVTDHITSQRSPIYVVASVLSFAGGAVTAGVNNGLQRVVEMWHTADVKNRIKRVIEWWKERKGS